MRRKKGLRKLALLLVLCLFMSMFSMLSITASAASITISGFDNTGTLNVHDNGATTPGDGVKIDDDVTISGSSNFADGYLQFKKVGPAVAGDKIEIKPDTDPNAYGSISVNKSVVYLGTGGDKRQIGTIDSTENGADGKNLKINFATPLPNGGFEDSDQSWTYNNNFISLSGDSAKQSGGSTTVEVKKKNPYSNWDWVDTADGSSSYMRMYLSCWLKTPYGTIHGPSITSKSFEAATGDKVSLYYYAKNT